VFFIELPISSATDNPMQYSFGTWRFNPETGDLSDTQSTTRLEPKVSELLSYFLSHQERVISRDELIESVWNNRTVSDDAINRCVSILRQLLSPNDTHAFIETVTRRGYIAHFPTANAQPREDIPAKPHRKILLGTTVLVLAIAGTYLLLNGKPEQAEESEEVDSAAPPVVAVLPFSTAGEGSDAAFFANGMHEDLLTQLAQLSAIRVISRTSVFHYRDDNRNLREIGDELGADVILEGNVQSVGNQIRINIQLIDASTDAHLWAQTYDRELSPDKLFAIQSEISRAIAAALHTTLGVEDTSQLSVLPTQNMAAYRAYHEAMAIRDTTGIYDPAYLEQLETAVTLDPEFVRAWAELAGFLSLQNFSRSSPESIARVESILERIRELAPASVDYIIAQAYYTYYVLRNYPQALQLITRAQEMRPSEARLLDLKGWIQRRLGDFDGIVESSRLAQDLDPLNPYWTLRLVRNLVTAHRYEEASQAIAKSRFDNYELSVLEIILELRFQRDFAWWVAEIRALGEEYPEDAEPLDLWDALIANRQFIEAEQLLPGLPAGVEANNQQSLLANLPDKLSRQVFIYWFLKQDDRLNDLLPRLPEIFEKESETGRDWREGDPILVAALVSAAGGDTRETEELVKRWRRAVAEDLAQLSLMRGFACRLLGMAAATNAAVDCIRSAVEVPSSVMPFVEPYLPYYDPIRREPAFDELMTELAQNSERGP
jgi:TolB-like protein/DNA-binding winged helix-turn-helix (wHTH) protein